MIKNIELGDLTDKNIGQLALLNNTTLPVNYEEKFYQKLLTNGFITKLAFFNDVMVGAVSCRIDPPKEEYVEDLCNKEKYEKISLHVQIGSDAIEFYKKFNFKEEGLIKNYYRNIEPTDCYLMSKPVQISA
ncbi:hypothetical protein DICPUDRAFT_76997 [Dictyostelium purpureum]|uniref:N-acetyltransferase domain-containing protein n=1 Tax=Dictyostelium purpureum TaxID=5786 RepID=F0ZFA6_DICPU|nr:uncharacterized protein DICPUDRAFT_76997 [Dictyostelium purpureum]EGC37372.1 hypothetical protein DICPUDRAFT_76997 [Dictyostelium purpureum]|eukprot:XP_003286113.1 hypothetical protein DICPUDRAFT_76997 [Dictyostelium purpureum]